MGCTASRLKPGAMRVCVTSLEESCQTGDLVLFSSRHAASQMTKCFTASAWDHCGLVVKLSPKHVLILEYAGGVYLYPLFTRLCTPPQIELPRSRSAAKQRSQTMFPPPHLRLFAIRIGRFLLCYSGARDCNPPAQDQRATLGDAAAGRVVREERAGPEAALD